MTAPILIEANADVILQDELTNFQTITGKTLYPGQPEYMICAARAYSYYLLLQRINSAAVNMLIDFASAPMLDFLVALVDVDRLPAQPATCTLQFNLVAGHAPIVISAGMRVSSSDGLAIFIVDFDTTVLQEENLKLVTATCITDGIVGNGYAPGIVKNILDAQAYISSVANTDITANGSNAESDDELRARAKTAPASFSTAGPLEGYKYWAKSVSPLIIDIEVMTANEDDTIDLGEVDVYPLLVDGGIPDNELLNKVTAILNGERIRPMNDRPVAIAPTAIHFTISIEATKLASSTITTLSLENTIKGLLANYKIAKYSRLGLDIIETEIESLCRIEGIYDLSATITPVTPDVLTGRNIVVPRNRFAMLDSYTVTITGTNNG